LTCTEPVNNAEVTVRDNIQPVLCIIVMACDDMETRHGAELRIYFTLLI